MEGVISILELNKIYNENCLEGMKRIDDKSINLIVIDPPYNISKAEWDKWKTVEDYVQFMGKVFIECQRVLKDNGSFYFFHNDFEQMAELQIWLKKNTKFIFKQLIVWNKRYNGSPRKWYFDNVIQSNMDRNYRLMAEYCLFYTFQDSTGLEKLLPNIFEDYYKYMSNERKTLNLSIKDIENMFDGKSIVHKWFERTQPRLINKINLKELSESTNGFNITHEELIKLVSDKRQEYEALRQEYERDRYIFNNQKTHHSVWDYEITHIEGHITPKPLEMIRHIINTSSNENDIVLDCFMGSGTTAIASINTNRQYIGFELDTTYFELANDRINKHIADTLDTLDTIDDIAIAKMVEEREINDSGVRVSHEEVKEIIKVNKIVKAKKKEFVVNND